MKPRFSDLMNPLSIQAPRLRGWFANSLSTQIPKIIHVLATHPICQKVVKREFRPAAQPQKCVVSFEQYPVWLWSLCPCDCWSHILIILKQMRGDCISFTCPHGQNSSTRLLRYHRFSAQETTPQSGGSVAHAYLW